MKSIGLLELNSISKGIEATDGITKAAEVSLAFAKTVCPGKFIILFHGDIGAVETSIGVGLAIGGHNVVNHLIIPHVHPDLMPAINAVSDISGVSALGIVEYFDIASSIIGADAAAKSGNVRLIEVRLGVGIGGKSYFTLCGAVSDVKSAVAAGVADTEHNGAVVNSCVIPSPTPELFRALL